jgi:hypothetical protein
MLAMRAWMLVVLTFAVSISIIDPAEAAKRCTGAACGTLSCSEPTVPARDGVTRRHELSCDHVREVTLLEGPSAGRVEDLVATYPGIAFRFTPEAGNESDQTFRVRLAGTNGTAGEVTVRVDVIPRSENTAPWCQPVEKSQRSDGTAPVVVSYSVLCFDDEDDPMVLDGGGPGTHLNAPRELDRNGGFLWNYRTATSSGVEHTTYWATDVLGAQSEPADVMIEVGPSDKPTTCRPNPGTFGYDAWPVFTRPGRVRNFGMVCEDLDGDDFTVLPGKMPTQGLLTINSVRPPDHGWWGTHQFIDATYVPADDGPRADPFTLTTITGGVVAEHEMQMLTPADDWINPGGCSWFADPTSRGLPTTVLGGCDDDEGDPIDVKVVKQPEHGTIGAPVSTPALYGREHIRLAYVPDPGFVGIDCVVLEVNGEFVHSIDVVVDELPASPVEVPDVPAPELPLPDDGTVFTPLPEDPSPPADAHEPPTPRPETPAAPSTPAPRAPAIPARPSSRAAAAAALGGADVVVVRRLGSARVWAARSSVRRGLPRSGGAALAVTCEAVCPVRWRPDVAGARASSALARGTAAPGRALVLALPRGRQAKQASFMVQVGRQKATVRLAVRR